MNQPILSRIGTKRDLLFAEIAQVSESAPDRQALFEPDGFGFSYGQVWTMLETLRALLEAQGILAHEVVAVVLPDALCCLISILGVARVCACAPINPAIAEAELEKDLVELGAVAVLIAHENKTFSAVGARLGLLVIDASLNESAGSWRVHVAAAAMRRSEVLLPGGTALLLHTSATTGRRKVVPLTDGNLEAMLGNTSRSLQLRRDDRLLLMARLFHIQGILGAWAQLRAGGCVIAGLEYSPHGFQRWMVTQSPTWYTGGRRCIERLSQTLGLTRYRCRLRCALRDRAGLS